MGKITSIYLTDEEASGLKKFCEANQCSQYSALKLGLRDLLFNVENLPYTGKIEQSQVPVEPEVPDTVRKSERMGLLQRAARELAKWQT